MTHLPILVIIVPLLFSFFIPPFTLLVPRKYKLVTVLGSLTILALTIAAMVVSNQQTLVYPVGGWGLPMGIVLVLDTTTAFMLFFVAIMFVPIVKYSFHFITRGGARYYYTVLFLFWCSLNGMILTGDLFNLIVFIEISSVVTYGLIAYDGTPRALEAAFKYMFIGTIGAAFIILATIIIYNSTGVLNIAVASELLANMQPSTLIVCIILYIAGFIAKLALVPAQWLADGHFAAPSPISALLSGASMKVFVFAMFRILYNLFGWDTISQIGITNFLLYLGALTSIAGALLAMGQKNVKRMLAFSTVTQIGFIVMAFSTGTSIGISAALFHIMNHGLMKGALFLSVGTLAEKVGSEELEDLRGIARKYPLSGLAFLLGSLAIVGIPLFNGFISKWYMGINLAQLETPIPIIALVFASILGVIYYFNAIGILFDHSQDSSQKTRQSAPALLFGILCLLGGIIPGFTLNWLLKASEAFLRYNDVIRGTFM